MGSENIKLGSATFCWNGIKQDYHLIETCECLLELSDELSVVVGGDDGTVEAFNAWLAKQNSDKTIHIRYISKEEWDAQVGREKLSFFSNMAIERLTTPWFVYVQADEILHENDFPVIRDAVSQANDVVSLGENQIDALFLRRLNLWKDPLHMLNVPQERKPVSTEVVRIARANCRCYDDAEQLMCERPSVYDNLDAIQIYHTGFVRDDVKHLEKIRHMQTEVFLWGDFDVKAKNCEKFEPSRWFSDEDLAPIPDRPLPKFIQQWAKERHPGLGI
jgi:hypothetical protein